MFLSLAKRVAAKALQPHLLRLVADAYHHPNLASHQRIRKAAQIWYGLARDGFLGRRVSRFFVEAVYQAQLDLFRRGSDLDLGTSPIGYEDLVLHCRSSDANSSLVYLYGFSDNLTYFALYRDHVRPGSIAIDVGANLGIHSLVLSRCVGRQGSVLAYEPSGALHDRLLRNIEVNHASNVVVRRIGLWERSGKVGFDPRADDFNIGKGKMSPASRVQVEARTVDEEAENLGTPIDLIKIDVEGAELAVLKGARKTLSRHKPVLILEFAPDQYRFKDLLDQIPYAVRHFTIPYTFWESLAPLENLDFDKRADLLIVPSEGSRAGSAAGPEESA